MTDHIYIAAGLCLLLAGFLAWKESRRSNRLHLVSRITAALLAVAALYFIAVPLSYHKTEKRVDAKEAILLTEGFDADSLDAFLQKTGSRTPVLTLDENIAAIHNYHATLITDPDELKIKEYRALHVFGYGMGADKLKEQAIVFHPSLLPTGITSVYWQQRVYSGQAVQVQGIFHNMESSPVKLTLLAYGNTIDSVSIPANGDHLFQFVVIPKQSGRAVYTILGIAKKDTVVQEPVAIEVMPAAPLKLLLLASSPDFENKFLRNWLAEKGYTVVSRTTISANKTAKEYFNTPRVNVDHLTPSLLDSFDLVITDPFELNSLSSVELGLLRSAVNGQGKGLIVKADSASPRSLFYTSLFPLQHADTGMQHTTEAILTGTNTVLQSLPSAPAWFIHPRNGTQPLVQDRQRRILASSALYGAGRIVISTLPNTYSWMLSGNQHDYNKVWSELISKAAARKTEDESLQLSKQLPAVNEPVVISVNASDAIANRTQLSGSDIYLLSDTCLPGRWKGLFWPRNKGWQTGVQLNGMPYYWYAYDADDWKTVANAGRLRLMQEMGATSVKTNENTTERTTSEEIPSIIFFLIFLGSCGYLWFENKYFNA